MEGDLFVDTIFEQKPVNEQGQAIDTQVIDLALRDDDGEVDPDNVSIFTHENRQVIDCLIEQDEFTEHASKAFDITFDGKSESKLWSKPDVPKDFGLGLIVGSSGSGKSTLLKEFGSDEAVFWDPSRAIVSHFDTPQQAVEQLMATGLNSIPTWLRPYHCLSTGEKFRADLARKLVNGAVIDEFTSVVNRDVACATSRAVRRYVTKKDLQGIVIASCHRDILEWLEPDWYFDTDNGDLVVGRSLRRPRVILRIFPCAARAWAVFARHHYLRHDLNIAAKCFLATWRNNLVGFVAVLPFPSGSVSNAFREHRLVVLPDFQGLGIGVRFSDTIAQLYKNEGKRYFSRTAHPKLGQYRNRSSKWRQTSQNGEISTGKGKKMWTTDEVRKCYAHEYIAEKEC